MAGRHRSAVSAAPAGDQGLPRRRQRREPYTWLGAGAVTLGVGVAMAGGAGVAHADGVSSSDRSAKGHGTAAPPVAGTSPANPQPNATAPKVKARKAAASNSAAAREAGRAEPAPPPVSATAFAPHPRDVKATNSVAGQSFPVAAPVAASHPVKPAPAAATVAVAVAVRPVSAVSTAAAGSASTSLPISTTIVVAILKFVGSVLTVLGADPLSPTGPGPSLSPGDNPFGAMLWSWFRHVQTSLGVAPPVAGTPTSGSPDPTTGAVTGTLGATEQANLPLTYTVTSAPKLGSVALTPSGAYTYTPTVAARQSAAESSSPISDTFTVTIGDGLASTAETVTASVSPQDKPVAGTPTVGAPDAATGMVTGTTNFIDRIGAALTYGIATQPTQGVVTLDGLGDFTYTPTTAARLAAWSSISGATDSFTFTANNGTASTSETVTVSVSPMQIPISAALAVAVSPNGKTAYVSTTGTTIDVINTATLTVSGTIDLVNTGASLAVSPDGATLYAAGGGIVSVISTATDTVSATVPTADQSIGQVVVAPNGTVYVSEQTLGSVAVIDPVTDTVTHTITAGGPPYETGIALSPDGSTLYSASNANVVSVINVATNTVTATITAGGATPYGLAVSPDGSDVYVTIGSGSVAVIDTATNTVATTIPVGGQPLAVAISADGSTLFLGDYHAGFDPVVAINTSTDTANAIYNWNAGTDRDAIAVSPDSTYLYVAGSSTTADGLAVIPLTSSAHS